MTNTLKSACIFVLLSFFLTPTHLFAKDHITNDPYYDSAEFNIERMSGVGGTNEQIANVGTDFNSYSDAGLTENIDNDNRVKEYNLAGNSGYTNEEGFSTFASWNIQVVDDRQFITGSHNSIVVDTMGRPHISYFSSEPFVSNSLQYAYLNGSLWDLQEIDSNGGTYNDIALDSSGNAHISYVGAGDIRYAYWNGSSWITETVDTGGAQTAITLDSSGHTHIVYNNGLTYAYWNGSEWVIETLSTNTSMFINTSKTIEVDSTAYPHVLYFGENNVLTYAFKDASGWNTHTVPGASGHYNVAVSLTLDVDDTAHISYHAYPDNIMYARWNGSSWDSQIVETGISVCVNTSVAIDSVGNPHISYHACYEYNGALRYASWNGSSWDIQTIDTSSNVGYPGSLDLDSSDRPHISYFDLTNNSLKYATSAVALSGTPGDSNGDGLVDGGDISALALEICDGDGYFSVDTRGGTFPGDPVGSDANEDGIVDAGDISCTVLLIFNGPGACGGSAASVSASEEPLYGAAQ